MSFRFVEDESDPFQRLALLDMARTMTRDRELQLDFAPASYLDDRNKTIYLNEWWNEQEAEQKRWRGLMSDVCLRCAQWHHTDREVTKKYMQEAVAGKLPRLARHIFIVLEEERLKQAMLTERPGTGRFFAVRRHAHLQFFQTKSEGHLQREEVGDQFFTAFYLRLISNEVNPSLPPLPSALEQWIQGWFSRVALLPEAESTVEVAERSRSLLEAVSPWLDEDMQAVYFDWPMDQHHTSDNREVAGEDVEQQEATLEADSAENDSGERYDEQLPVWEQETADKTDHFLQAELEQGERIAVDEAASFEENGEAPVPATKKGDSRPSTGRDDGQEDALDPSSKELRHWAQELHQAAVPIHRKVQPIILPLKPISDREREQYHQLKKDIWPDQRKLMKTLQLTLEQKQMAARDELLIGRLTRRLTKLVTEEHPRLFYKKKEQALRYDAVFVLLVDCSASMHDKMAETRRGITLFHETLKALLIPHMIVGFWEESGLTGSSLYPNYFLPVIRFEDSLLAGSGPSIMHLEPKQDNRDGYAIRLLSRMLKQRVELKRCLLVFSDGEPAAEQYGVNGIIDTYEAVLEARREGIDVFNLYLAEQMSEKTERVLSQIYGRQSIAVKDISQINAHLLPLLRNLLRQAMG